MSVKELTKLYVTDLWNDSKRLGDYWEVQEEAGKEFRRRFIERDFRQMTRRTMSMSWSNHNRSKERIGYAGLRRLNEQWGKEPLKEVTQNHCCYRED